MYPQVDIRKIADGDYSYSVSIADAGHRHVRDGLASIAECLHDAATALSDHFSVASISFAGHALGDYHVAAMEHRTVALAETLRRKLAHGDSGEPAGS
jgi:hypothetical protein